MANTCLTEAQPSLEQFLPEGFMTGPRLTEALRSAEAPPVIVAELSGNHRGELSRALELVDAAVDAGADAVKLQTYRPDTITVDCRDERFLLKEGLWAGRYLHDLYDEAMTPWEWHIPLAERAAEKGLALFSSPFDETAVQFLEENLNPPLHKIASCETNHLPLLRTVARTGKPVVVSVGASTSREISDLLELLQSEGCPLVVLLQCVSEYPAEHKDFHLLSIPALEKEFEVLVGLSDHSPGHVVPVVATALGARLIEKHLVLDREDGSIDAGFSMEPSEFRDMCTAVRQAHSSLGEPRLGIAPEETGARRFRRSILVSAQIRSGDVLSTDNLRVARPSDGLCPSRWEEVLGCRASRDMEVGHPLAEGDWRE